MSKQATTHAADDALADARIRDEINNERFTIRRQLRALRADEQQLEREMAEFAAREAHTEADIEQSYRAQHWGKAPERGWAWRSAASDAGGQPPAQGSTPASGGHTEDRVSWRALDIGSDVISADGSPVGAVQEVVGEAATDIFEGVVVDTRLGPGGLRFVEAASISDIFEHRIVLAVTRLHVQDLPAMSPRHRRLANARRHHSQSS